ncbi:pol polyprotein [Tanacetum coccineum]
MRIEVLLGIHEVWDVVDPGLVDAKKDNIVKGLLFQSIPEYLVLQIGNLKTEKEMWEAIKTRNLGDDRVKEASLQTLITEFKNLKMSYNGTIDEYATKLSGIASKSATLGEVMSDHRKEVFVGSECRKLLEYIATIAWNIWKSRNRLVFENTQPCPDQVISTSNIMVHEADSTLSHFSASNPSVLYGLSQESSHKWVPPTSNIVKLNCDGAFKWNQGAVGIVARDCEGSLLLCLGERWHTSSVLATELIALRTACSLAMTKGWYGAIIESDSQLAISLASSDSDPPWSLATIVSNINDWASQLHLRFSWIPRTCNRVAHIVAGVAFNSVSNYIWDVNFPVEITSAVRNDLV